MTLETGAWIVSSAARSAALASLWRSRIRLPWFRAWLAASLARSAALALSGGPTHRAYAALFAASDPLLLALLTLAVREIFALRAACYPRLGQLGGWVLALAIAAGVAIALATLAAPVAASLPRALYATRRAVMAALLMALLLALVFFRWARLPGTSALETHHLLMCLFLLSESALYVMLAPAGRSAAAAANAIALGLQAVVFAGWAWSLRSGPDNAEAEPGDPEDAWRRLESEVRDRIRWP